MRDQHSPLASFIESFLLAKRLTPKSRKEYERYLAEFDAFMGHGPLEDFGPDIVGRWISDLSKRSRYSARFGCAVMKSFATWLAKSGHLLTPYGGSVLHALETPQVPRDGRQPMSDHELDIIWRVLDDRINRDRARAKAYVWLLFATGLRKNEARQLRLEDIHIEPDGHSFVVARWETTKGKETRAVRLDPAAAGPIHEYILDHRPTFHGQGPEPLFLTEEGKAFTEGGFGNWAGRIADEFEAAGVRDWKPHRMRHTWATWYNRGSGETGNTFYDLKREGGWRNDQTVHRYVKDRSWEELRLMATPIGAVLNRPKPRPRN